MTEFSAGTRTIRVALVDDHAMVRQGIKDRLERETDIVVVGEADNREAGIALVEQLMPDVVVLDIRLRNDSGIEVAKKLRADHPGVKILILSISKENSQEELVQAIREVISGGAVLTPKVASKVMRAMSEQPIPAVPAMNSTQADDLTLREVEVLELLREGMRNQGIAEHLAISPRTVESHVARIMAKLGATSRTEAIRTAEEIGILQQ